MGGGGVMWGEGGVLGSAAIAVHSSVIILGKGSSLIVLKFGCNYIKIIFPSI